MSREQLYEVVKNNEEQYSLWPSARPMALGWVAVGFTGTREQCLSYIEDVWTDMSPLSTRSSV